MNNSKVREIFLHYNDEMANFEHLIVFIKLFIFYGIKIFLHFSKSPSQQCILYWKYTSIWWLFQIYIFLREFLASTDQWKTEESLQFISSARKILIVYRFAVHTICFVELCNSEHFRIKSPQKFLLQFNQKAEKWYSQNYFRKNYLWQCTLFYHHSSPEFLRYFRFFGLLPFGWDFDIGAETTPVQELFFIL